MENNQKKKEKVTLEAIAELINASTKVLEAKIDKSAEEVATMTQKQFLELGQDVTAIKNDVKDIKEDMENIKADLHKKVEKIDQNTLRYRVEKLEEKFA